MLLRSFCMRGIEHKNGICGRCFKGLTAIPHSRYPQTTGVFNFFSVVTHLCIFQFLRHIIFIMFLFLNTYIIIRIVLSVFNKVNIFIDAYFKNEKVENFKINIFLTRF